MPERGTFTVLSYHLNLYIGKIEKIQEDLYQMVKTVQLNSRTEDKAHTKSVDTSFRSTLHDVAAPRKRRFPSTTPTPKNPSSRAYPYQIRTCPLEPPIGVTLGECSHN